MSNKNNNFEIKILLFIENLARILYSREGACKAQRQEVGAGSRGQRGGGRCRGRGSTWGSHIPMMQRRPEPRKMRVCKTAKVVTTPSGVSANHGGGVK